MTFRARCVRGGHYKSRPGCLASFKQTNQSAASEALSIRLLLHLEWRIGSECEGRSWGKFSPLSLSVFLWLALPCFSSGGGERICLEGEEQGIDRSFRIEPTSRLGFFLSLSFFLSFCTSLFLAIFLFVVCLCLGPSSASFSPLYCSFFGSLLLCAASFLSILEASKGVNRTVLACLLATGSLVYHFT